MNKTIDELILMKKRQNGFKRVLKNDSVKTDPNTTATEFRIQRGRIKIVRDDIIVFTVVF